MGNKQAHKQVKHMGNELASSFIDRKGGTQLGPYHVNGQALPIDTWSPSLKSFLSFFLSDRRKHDFSLANIWSFHKNIWNIPKQTILLQSLSLEYGGFLDESEK